MMYRRTFIQALVAAAATAAPLTAIAATSPGLRCPRCFGPAHFHRIDRTKLGDAGWIEHWMTPKGEVHVTRWASMDDPEMRSHIEVAMEAIYGRLT